MNKVRGGGFFLRKPLDQNRDLGYKKNYHEQYAQQLVLVARDGGLVRYVHRQV
jgi:hypothetical protein